MTNYPKKRIGIRSHIGEIQRKELSFFQAMLNIFSGALKSENLIEREAAKRATVKVRRIIRNIQGGSLGRSAEEVRSGTIRPIGR